MSIGTTASTLADARQPELARIKEVISMQNERLEGLLGNMRGLHAQLVGTGPEGSLKEPGVERPRRGGLIGDLDDSVASTGDLIDKLDAALNDLSNSI